MEGKGRSRRLRWGGHTNKIGGLEPVEEAGGAEAGEWRLGRVLGASPSRGRSIAIANTIAHPGGDGLGSWSSEKANWRLDSGIPGCPGSQTARFDRGRLGF